MNKLEKEIIENLAKSKRPLSIDRLLAMSKITKHSRRLNAAILKLEGKKILFLRSIRNENARFANEYGINGVHIHGF